MSRELERFEALVARALVAREPASALADAARDEGLTGDLRERLTAADPEGVTIAGLLVARLRFERLMHGSRAAGEWFERDPATFAAAFKRYHTSVKPTACLPSDEAGQFERWVEETKPG